jgi:hypothetical protein
MVPITRNLFNIYEPIIIPMLLGMILALGNLLLNTDTSALTEQQQNGFMITYIVIFTIILLSVYSDYNKYHFKGDTYYG